MDARGKFGEHERSVRVARGAAESNSSLACVYRVMDARGKFGEHERSVRYTHAKHEPILKLNSKKRIFH